MTIRFHCPDCRHSLKADEAEAGRRARCTRCRAVVEIPHSSDDDAADPEPMFVTRQPRFTAHRSATIDDEIDMTPMIDVVFQLLIFFMVTAAMSLQKTLPATSQSTGTAAVSPLEQLLITVHIEADNTMLVDDEMVVDRQDLVAKLRRRQTAAGGERRMIVSAAGEALHEFVVTAIDAGHAAGMNEVRLVAAEEP